MAITIDNFYPGRYPVVHVVQMFGHPLANAVTMSDIALRTARQYHVQKVKDKQVI